jgi:RNA polymerase sigma factor (sigma-70 family)
MATGQPRGVIRHLRQAALLQGAAGLTDGELLGRFIARRDEAAFEALVRRHGPMVLGVCRRVLENDADAEDAFQATFLVLVRKAQSVVPRALVGNWLYGVAHSTALKAKAMNRKRRAKEREAAAMPRPETPNEAWPQLRAVLDEELRRLPDKYRVPIVLCDLEGKPVKEAARQLGWPQGTVASRLSRGRARLAQRLARRGLAVSGGALAAWLARGAASACVPGPVMMATLKAASFVAAGQGAAAGVVSAKVAALADGVIRAMFVSQLKTATAVLLAVATVGLCVGGLAYHTRAGRPEAPQPQPAQAPKGEGKPADVRKDGKADEKAKTDPPGVPLEARLVANKDTYTLNLGGKTPEEFRKLLHAGHYPAAPQVDLVLEFHNTGDKEIKFLTGGTNPDIPLLLQLHGHGAVNVPLAAVSSKMKSLPPEQVSLAPGKSYALAIKSLRTNNAGREGSASYWTEPGEYKLIVTYQTAVSPVPKDAKESHAYKGFGTVTLTTSPLKLKVVEAEK